MKVGLTIALFFAGTMVTLAQDDWLTFPGNSDNNNRPNSVNLQYGIKKGKVTLHEDARMDKLAEFVRADEASVEGVKIDGYRIVIFFDQDKSTVAQQKANFMARYNDHRAYIDYVAPNYRVRVGNFRTRLEAEALKSDLLVNFPTAVVVEDKIQLPVLPE